MRIRLLHLVGVLALSTVAASIGGVLATYWVIEDEVQDLLDDDLEAQSELLAELLAAHGGLVSADELEQLIRPIFEPDQEETLWVNVFDPSSGRQVSNLDHSLPMPLGGSRMLDLEQGGHRWAGYQHDHPGGPVVQLLHRRDRYQEVREEVLEGVALGAIAVSGVNLLLLAGLTYLFIGPLNRLARDLLSRKPDALAPVAVETPAWEVAVLRDALNGLMADVERVLTRERAFANDVAHELRTPLTTLKLELSSGEPDLDALKAEVDRLVALVNQLLTLARLERSAWRDSFEEVALDSLYADRLGALEPRLTAAGLTLHTTLAPVKVRGDPMLLGVLLQNLVDNVVRHCPAGTRLEVDLTDSGCAGVLRIADTGGGIAPPGRERLNRGFARLDGRGPGLGLGLAICHKIADVHGARLGFHARSDGQAGLEVRVVFPA